MTKYFYSGVDRASFIELLAMEGAAGMVNASVAGQEAIVAAYNRWPEVRLVLDSGAFQGNSNLTGYAELIKKIGWRFDWYANLDVIGNQQASDDNWQALVGLGISPLWVYQVKGGRKLDYLKSVADVRRFVGIGGLVPVIREDVGHAVDLIGNIGRELSAVDATAHFFGVSTPAILSRYANEPWFASADSQAWIAGFKAREIINVDGRRVKVNQLGYHFTGRECAAQNIRTIHSWLSSKNLQLSFDILNNAQ